MLLPRFKVPLQWLHFELQNIKGKEWMDYGQYNWIHASQWISFIEFQINFHNKKYFFPKNVLIFFTLFSKEFDGFNYNLTKISKARSKASCGDSCEQYIDLKGFDGDLHMLTTMKRIKKGSGHCCLNRQKG